MPCLSEFGREFGVKSCHFAEGVIQFVEVAQKLVVLVAQGLMVGQQVLVKIGQALKLEFLSCKATARLTGMALRRWSGRRRICGDAMQQVSFQDIN